MDILHCADTLVLGSTLRDFVVYKHFDKEHMEEGIMSWMPSKVRKVFTLWLT